MERRKGKYDVIVLVVSYMALVAFNALGEALRFGGTTAADVSNEVFAWFAPAGYVFSIWAVIYIGLAIWGIRFVRGNRNGAVGGRPSVSAEAALFAASCALNILWLVLWHLRVFVASIFAIVALLAVVAVLYRMTWRRSSSWLDRAPVSLYASWLAVATVANIAHVATRSATADAGVLPAVSTLVLLLLFAVLAFFARRLLGDYVFGLVVAWAGIGIGVRLSPVSPLVGVAAILISTLGVAVALLPWERLSFVSKGERRV